MRWAAVIAPWIFTFQARSTDGGDIRKFHKLLASQVAALSLSEITTHENRIFYDFWALHRFVVMSYCFFFCEQISYCNFIAVNSFNEFINCLNATAFLFFAIRLCNRNVRQRNAGKIHSIFFVFSVLFLRLTSNNHERCAINTIVAVDCCYYYSLIFNF